MLIFCIPFSGFKIIVFIPLGGKRINVFLRIKALVAGWIVGHLFFNKIIQANHSTRSGQTFNRARKVSTVFSFQFADRTHLAMSTVLREPSCECERGRPGEGCQPVWAWGATPTAGSRSEPARRAQTRAVDFFIFAYLPEAINQLK